MSVVLLMGLNYVKRKWSESCHANRSRAIALENHLAAQPPLLPLSDLRPLEETEAAGSSLAGSGCEFAGLAECDNSL